MLDEYLKPPEVSKILGVTVHTLQMWRQRNTFPDLKVIKMGKLVRYKRSTVEKFMESQER